MPFLIENAHTRASLKIAFDHLFKKYGRDFSEDDEIDLMDLEIVKTGSHIDKVKPRFFGSCFKKFDKHENGQEEHIIRQTSPTKEDPEENYDDVFVRLTQKVRQAQSFPLPPLRRKNISMEPKSSMSEFSSPLSSSKHRSVHSPVKLKSNSTDKKDLREKFKIPKRLVPRGSMSFDDCLLELIQSEESPAATVSIAYYFKICSTSLKEAYKRFLGERLPLLTIDDLDGIFTEQVFEAIFGATLEGNLVITEKPPAESKKFVEDFVLLTGCGASSLKHVLAISEAQQRGPLSASEAAYIYFEELDAAVKIIQLSLSFDKSPNFISMSSAQKLTPAGLTFDFAAFPKSLPEDLLPFYVRYRLLYIVHMLLVWASLIRFDAVDDSTRNQLYDILVSCNFSFKLPEGYADYLPPDSKMLPSQLNDLVATLLATLLDFRSLVSNEKVRISSESLERSLKIIMNGDGSPLCASIFVTYCNVACGQKAKIPSSITMAMDELVVKYIDERFLKILQTCIWKLTKGWCRTATSILQEIFYEIYYAILCFFELDHTAYLIKGLASCLKDNAKLVSLFWTVDYDVWERAIDYLLSLTPFSLVEFLELAGSIMTSSSGADMLFEKLCTLGPLVSQTAFPTKGNKAAYEIRGQCVSFIISTDVPKASSSQNDLGPVYCYNVHYNFWRFMFRNLDANSSDDVQAQLNILLLNFLAALLGSSSRLASLLEKEVSKTDPLFAKSAGLSPRTVLVKLLMQWLDSGDAAEHRFHCARALNGLQSLFDEQFLKECENVGLFSLEHGLLGHVERGFSQLSPEANVPFYTECLRLLGSMPCSDLLTGSASGKLTDILQKFCQLRKLDLPTRCAFFSACIEMTMKYRESIDSTRFTDTCNSLAILMRSLLLSMKPKDAPSLVECLHKFADLLPMQVAEIIIEDRQEAISKLFTFCSYSNDAWYQLVRLVVSLMSETQMPPLKEDLMNRVFIGVAKFLEGNEEIGVDLSMALISSLTDSTGVLDKLLEKNDGKFANALFEAIRKKENPQFTSLFFQCVIDLLDTNAAHAQKILGLFTPTREAFWQFVSDKILRAITNNDADIATLSWTLVSKALWVTSKVEQFDEEIMNALKPSFNELVHFSLHEESSMELSLGCLECLEILTRHLSSQAAFLENQVEFVTGLVPKFDLSRLSMLASSTVFFDGLSRKCLKKLIGCICERFALISDVAVFTCCSFDTWCAFTSFSLQYITEQSEPHVKVLLICIATHLQSAPSLVEIGALPLILAMEKPSIADCVLDMLRVRRLTTDLCDYMIDAQCLAKLDILRSLLLNGKFASLFVRSLGLRKLGSLLASLPNDERIWSCLALLAAQCGSGVEEVKLMIFHLDVYRIAEQLLDVRPGCLLDFIRLISPALALDSRAFRLQLLAASRLCLSLLCPFQASRKHHARAAYELLLTLLVSCGELAEVADLLHGAGDEVCPTCTKAFKQHLQAEEKERDLEALRKALHSEFHAEGTKDVENFPSLENLKIVTS